MKKYQFGIILAATQDSAFSIGTLLLNIQHKMQNIDVFYICNDGFSQNDKKIMQKIVNNGGGQIVFIDFTFDDFSANVKQYNPKATIEKTQILSRYTHMTYARFEALKFLGECEVIVYLDFDMLLLKSIEELAHIGNFDMACFKGSATLSEGLGKLCPQHLQEFKNYSAGIIVFNNSDLIGMRAFIYKFIAEHYEDYFHEVKLGDQALLNLYLFENKLTIKELDDKYYGNISWIKSQNASIIHAWGMHNRFWNNRLCALAWQQWWIYYRQWLELGGSSYNGGWKANLEVPLSGGEVFQYFQRIQWAKEILAIPLEPHTLLLQADFSKKVIFNIVGLPKNIFLTINSNSIYNFILELLREQEVIAKQTISRNDLKKALPIFIKNQINSISNT